VDVLITMVLAGIIWVLLFRRSVSDFSKLPSIAWGYNLLMAKSHTRYWWLVHEPHV